MVTDGVTAEVRLTVEHAAARWALKQIVRFLDDPSLDELSDSMRASAARDLVERIGPSLLFAGVPVLGKDLPGARYWDGFVATVEGALAALRSP